ncbi:MAG: beta-N-acetylhexosaminidase, partial [Phycisphaeraceae bacterium]
MPRSADPLTADLLPTPRESHILSDAFTLDARARIHLPLTATDADRRSADALATLLKAHAGHRPRQAPTTRYIHHHVIHVGREPAFDIPRDWVPTPAEGYALRITRDGILLAGRDEAGLHYAVQTLAQVLRLRRRAGARVPGFDIRDWPAMRWRGVMVDVGRQVEKPDHLADMIRQLASFKKNMFVLYFENKYRWKSHPELAHPVGYTADDFKMLAATAAEHHVQFVPAFASLGHCEGLLRHPGLAHLREENAVYQLALRHKGTRRLLRDLYTELLPLYDGQFFHVNCDESPLLAGPPGAGKAWFRESLARFRDHLIFLHDLCARHGKRIMAWGDMLLHHPEILHGLPRDIVVVDWDYGPMLGRPARKATRWFRDQGFDVIVAPAAGRSAEVGVMKHMQIADNVPAFIQLGHDAGAVGEMTTMWEMFTTNPLVLWPGLVASAQCAWAPDTSAARLPRRVAAHLYGQSAAAPAVRAWRKLSGDAFDQRYFGGRHKPEIPGYRTYHIDAHELVPTDPMLYLTYKRDPWPKRIVGDASAGLDHLREAIAATRQAAAGGPGARRHASHAPITAHTLEAFETGGLLELYQGMLRQAVNDAGLHIVDAERDRRRNRIKSAASRVRAAHDALAPLADLTATLLTRVVATWKRTRHAHDPALEDTYLRRLRLSRTTLRRHLARLGRAADHLAAGRDVELAHIVGGQTALFYDAHNPSRHLVDVWQQRIEASDDGRTWRTIMSKGWFMLTRQHYAIAQVLDRGHLPRLIRLTTNRLHIDPERHPPGDRLCIRVARTLTPADIL